MFVGRTKNSSVWDEYRIFFLFQMGQTGLVFKKKYALRKKGMR